MYLTLHDDSSGSAIRLVDDSDERERELIDEVLCR